MQNKELVNSICELIERELCFKTPTISETDDGVIISYENNKFWIVIDIYKDGLIEIHAQNDIDAKYGQDSFYKIPNKIKEDIHWVFE